MTPRIASMFLGLKATRDIAAPDTPFARPRHATARDPIDPDTLRKHNPQTA